MSTAQPPLAADVDMHASAGTALHLGGDTTAAAAAASASGSSSDAAAGACCSFPFLHPSRMQSRGFAPPATATVEGAAADACADLFLCMEYPGFVSSVDKAVASVHGEEHIRKLLPPIGATSGGENLLKLYYRPHDSDSHPLFGEVARDLHRAPQSHASHTRRPDAPITGAATDMSAAAMLTSGESFFDFVVKVTRRGRKGRRKQLQQQQQQSATTATAMDTDERKEGDSATAAAHGSGSGSEEPEVRAQLLGMISTSVTFPGLCDFQLLHAPLPAIELDMPLLHAPTVHAAAAAAASSGRPGSSGPADAAAVPPTVPISRMCFLSNEPGDEYGAIAPLLFSRYDYAREYAFANHDNANAIVKNLQSIQAHTAQQRGAKAARTAAGGAADSDEEGTAPAAPASGSGTPKTAKVSKAPASGAEKKAHKSKIPASALKAARPAVSITGADAEGGEGGAATATAESDNEDGAMVDEEELPAEGAPGASSDEADAEQGQSAVKRGRTARRFFLAYTEPTPSGPKAGALTRPEVQQKPLVVRLRQYFAERPIFSTDCLLLKFTEEMRAAQSQATAAAAAAASEAATPSPVPGAGAAASAGSTPPAPRVPSPAALGASSELSRADLLHHLPAVAYRFSGGPWRNLWVRYGYDPREAAVAKEARVHQVVDFRVPRKLFEEMAERHGQVPTAHAAVTVPLKRKDTQHAAGGAAAASIDVSPPPVPTIAATAAAGTATFPGIGDTPAPLSAAYTPLPVPVHQIDVHFTRIPLRLHTKYQLLDLVDEEVKRIVNQTPVPTVCDVHSGWYPADSLRAVRRCMSLQMNAWCVAAGLPVLPPVGGGAGGADGGAGASGKKARKRVSTLGRQFAAAALAVHDPMAAAERMHKRNLKISATKRKRKEDREAEARARGEEPPSKKPRKGSKAALAAAAAAAADASTAAAADDTMLSDAAIAAATAALPAHISASAIRSATTVVQAVAAAAAGSSSAASISAGLARKPVPNSPRGAAHRRSQHSDQEEDEEDEAYEDEGSEESDDEYAD